jgi:hypothetical protein
MPFELRSIGVNVQMVRAVRRRRKSLDQEKLGLVGIVAPKTVAAGFERRDSRVPEREVVDENKNVDDRLGGQTGDSGRSNMFDDNWVLSKTAQNEFALGSKSGWPRRIVGLNANLVQNPLHGMTRDPSETAPKLRVSCSAYLQTRPRSAPSAKAPAIPGALRMSKIDLHIQRVLSAHDDSSEGD